MTAKHPRLGRESITIGVMLDLYCRRFHKNTGGTSRSHRGRKLPVEKRLCSECRGLLEYAQKRLDKCPFQEGKTTCVKCPVHCYTPAMRARVRTVMRYSGPRMLYRHPRLAVLHLIDGLRKKPLAPPGRRTGR